MGRHYQEFDTMLHAMTNKVSGDVTIISITKEHTGLSIGFLSSSGFKTLLKPL